VRRGWRWLFWALALSFAGGAIFHASAALDPTVEPRMDHAGHLAFIAINLAMIFGMLWRPRFFAIVFALFCLQQLASHGDWAWQAWRAGWIDWRSIITMVSLPLMLVALLLEPPRARAAS
jgi:hypothetical protein